MSLAEKTKSQIRLPVSPETDTTWSSLFFNLVGKKLGVVFSMSTTNADFEFVVFQIWARNESKLIFSVGKMFIGRSGTISPIGFLL